MVFLKMELCRKIFGRFYNMYHTKKIGVFISHIFGYYQKNVCQGIIDQANEFGYNVEIFTSLDGEHIEKHTLGENHILGIPNYDIYCGIIFASGTYLSDSLREDIRHYLTDQVSCPVIEITSSTPSFPCVTLENNSVAKELVSHLVHTHQAQRIAYLGSNAESEISMQRFANFSAALESEGLSIGPYDVYSCENKPSDVTAALDFFLTEPKLNAVICYNDALALTFMLEAMKKGYQIPSDFAVTGFDNTLDGDYVSPALTSVTFPVYELGTTAILQLMKLMQEEIVEPKITITSHLCIKESCGCQNNTRKNPIYHIKGLNQYIYNLESSMIKTMSMSNEFQHITNIDEGMLLLHKHVSDIEHCKEFYLCLSSDWDEIDSNLMSLEQATDFSKEEKKEHISSDFLLKLAVKDKNLLPECTFKKKELIPAIFMDDSVHAYIFTPLFFEDKSFGYIALVYENNQIDYHFQLISWVMNINQMLQSIRRHKLAAYMEQKVEDLYFKDPLTGFYNIQGLYYLSRIFLEQYNDNLNPLFIVSSIFLSIESLSDIGKKYGSSQKSFSIEVFSHALKKQVSDDCYCFRLAENEFYVLIMPKSITNVDTFIVKLKRYLNNYNTLSSKDYAINFFSNSSKSTTSSLTPDFLLSLFASAKNITD